MMIIMFLCGTQSIQPMDISLSEQDIAFLMEVNKKVMPSLEAYTSRDVEALLNMNQIVLRSLQNSQSQPFDIKINELIEKMQPEQQASYRKTALAVFNLRYQCALNSNLSTFQLLPEPPTTEAFSPQDQLVPPSTPDLISSLFPNADFTTQDYQSYQIPEQSTEAFGPQDQSVYPSTPDLIPLVFPNSDFITQDDQSYRIPEQPCVSSLQAHDQPKSSEDDESNDIRWKLLLKDYTRSLHFYKKKKKSHPLIKDGFIIKCENKYTCDQCKEPFKDFTHAQRHSIHHLGINFKCDKCDLYFTEQDTITQHMRREHCTCCQKTFDSQEALKEHRSRQTRNHNLHMQPIPMKKRYKDLRTLMNKTEIH